MSDEAETLLLVPRHLALAHVSIALLCKFAREAKSVQEHKRLRDSSVPFLAHHGRLAQVGKIKLRQIFRRNVAGRLVPEQRFCGWREVANPTLARVLKEDE